jgi:hypothetical protein
LQPDGVRPVGVGAAPIIGIDRPAWSEWVPAMPDLPPPTLWELFKSVSISECGQSPMAVQELIRQWRSPHPALENHRALPVIRRFVHEQWGTTLDRQRYLQLRDFVASERGITPPEAEALSLDEVAALLRTRMVQESTVRIDVEPARLSNPYRELLDFGETTYQKELQRAVSLGGRREGRSEWGPQMQAQDAALQRLVDAALCAAEETGFPVEEVERRVNALAKPVRAILLWQRDAGFLSAEERKHGEWSGDWHDPASDYLVRHYGRMQEARPAVHVLAVRFEDSGRRSGKTSSDGDTSADQTGGAPAHTHEPTPLVPMSVPMATGLLQFNLPAIFRCAVGLGAALSTETALHFDDEGSPSAEWTQCGSGEPDFKEKLGRRVEASRQCETAMARLMAVLNPSRAEFPRAWADAVNLADASSASRQALQTLGLALADLRGDRQWHGRGSELLSAGTWNLWDGLRPSDRKVVHDLLPETHRVWAWPTDPAGEPKPFTGLKATAKDARILTSGWRTVTTADLNALNDSVRLGRQQQLKRAEGLYPTLLMRAPEGTPLPVAAAYEAVAAALVRACYIRLHVLPVAGYGAQRDWSDQTRQRQLELPWGTMTTEEAARQAVYSRDRARAAYCPAEVPLRAALEPGVRCMFGEALDWIDAVANICERALGAQLPWDQAAAAIYTMPALGLSQILQKMRRQMCHAVLHAQRNATRDILVVDTGRVIASPERSARLPLPDSSRSPVPNPHVVAGDPESKLREPPDEAIKAYRLKWILGAPTQTEIAHRLSQEIGRPISQGQVSRWLKQAEKYVKAGGILPEMPKLPDKQPRPMDPERIDLGPRQDGRAERQRERRSDDD